MTKLIDLGFSIGMIAETVVSTYDIHGQPNAAPMGVTMKNLMRLVLRIYTSSVTYKNLHAKKCAVINITSNPELFYRTAFKETNLDGCVPKEWFEKAEIVDAPRLRMADEYIEVIVLDITPFDVERAEVTCDVKLVKELNVLPKVYCRASFATIEAIIHATRVKAYLADGDRQKQVQASKLIKKIRDCRDIVKHVAPNSSYSKIMTDLNKLINSWRIKSESLR